jgi:hypothetical protein
MDANKILQQYVLIKPNTYSINGHFDTPLQSLENVQIINKSDMTNGKLTNNYQFYHQQQPVGEKSDGKKPRPLIMSKRNARERRRVKMINLGYETLRLHVPGGAENKKLSKVDTLRRAVDYIKYLQTVLDVDSSCASPAEIKTENCSEDDISSQSSEIASMQNSYTQFSTIQQEQALLASEHTNTRSDVDERPSAGVMSDETQPENEMFIDIATWLLKTPNNYKSNIRLKGKSFMFIYLIF